MFVTVEDYENALFLFGETSGTIVLTAPGVLELTIPQLVWWRLTQRVLRKRMLFVMHQQLPLGVKLVVKEV